MGFIEIPSGGGGDFIATYDTILQTFDTVRLPLPNLGILVQIYDESDIQLLYRPLVDIYAAIISLGLKAAELYVRATHSLSTHVHSARNSLQSEFESSLTNLKKAGQRVEQAASVEHMYATDIIRKAQENEIQK